MAASVRAPYEMGLASGLGAITDVHGGAGARAAEFFRTCIARADVNDLPLETAQVLDVSIRKVMYDWRMARAWLKQEMN